MQATFFPTPAHFRKWLERHHATATELIVGFYKKATGRPSITWPESVDQALCFGWIDGIRKSIDADSYTIRFTPRRARSIWSLVNIRRVARLENEGQMRPAGRKAFAARLADRSRVYAFEQRDVTLPAKYQRIFRRHTAAWRNYRARPPGYRRTTAWWVMSAKKEETRLRRLHHLIASAAARRPVGPLTR